MRTYNIDIADLSETNFHYAHTQVKKVVQSVISQIWPRQKVVILERNTPWTSKYKPGETTIIITELLSNEVTKSRQDSEYLGRWFFATF